MQNFNKKIKLYSSWSSSKFSIFQTKYLFFLNNRTFSRTSFALFLYGILHYIISISKWQKKNKKIKKKSVHKTQCYINHTSNLNQKENNISASSVRSVFQSHGFWWTFFVVYKIGLSLSKKSCFIYFNGSPFKFMKNTFYFILKTLFILKMFKSLYWLFCYVVKAPWLER